MSSCNNILSVTYFFFSPFLLQTSIFFSPFSTTPAAAAAAAKSLQLCLTLCDPIDVSPRGSPVSGILQTGTLEGVATSFSNEWRWKVKVKLLCRVWLLATPWTAAYQAPPSMGFSRQEYWSGLPFSTTDCVYSFLPQKKKKKKFNILQSINTLYFSFLILIFKSRWVECLQFLQGNS